MKKTSVKLLSIVVLVLMLTMPVEACTSFILKAEDGSPVYGRTLEWGAFDAKSNLVLVPRNLSFTSELGEGKQGMTWKNKYGFVAINALNMPLYFDGMNEAGLVMGNLYMPGFAKYQPIEEGKESSSLNNMDLTPYILGQFETVDQIKEALPNLRVIYNKENEEKLGSPIPLHYVVADKTGESIVIEYVDEKLSIYDNDAGVMTNSPPYDWHVMNLRNYAELTPYADGPGDRAVGDVNFTPLGGGSGMTGLPGDYTPPSRFVRAFLYAQTTLPSQLENAETAINQASRILNNFDIPKGFLREGDPEDYHLGYTQWSTIGDIKNKRYYWWTEWNRQMRMVDLSKISFDGTETAAIPLDKERIQNITDRSGDFSKIGQ